jgi:cobalamin biosynthesis Co2+ chelatase CbiK
MFLVLHPRHKLEYFKKQKWEDLWVQAAHEIVRREFDRSYASVDVQVDDTRVGNDDAVSHT